MAALEVKEFIIKVDESTTLFPEMVEPMFDEILGELVDNPSDVTTRNLAKDSILERIKKDRENNTETTYGEAPGLIFAFLDGYNTGRKSKK